MFRNYRPIDRLLGRRYSRGQSKEAFKFPIRVCSTAIFEFAVIGVRKRQRLSIAKNAHRLVEGPVSNFVCEA